MKVTRWLMIAAVALSACGSSSPESAPTSPATHDVEVVTTTRATVDSTEMSSPLTAPGSVPDSTELPHDHVREIGHRVLADGAPTGDTWATALATNSNALTQLWAHLGSTGDVPDVEFDDEVVVFFGPAESSSCRFAPLTAIVHDPEAGRMYPVLGFEDPIPDGQERVCTSDANPHAIVVALPRDELPEVGFDIWVAPDDPPWCCTSEATPVEAGELTSYDPADTSGPRYGTRPAVDRLGQQIGSGATGPPLSSPRPWRIDTIYTDQPQELVVEFSPPDPDCIAATATATIGRAGAILVRLRVDDTVNPDGCADDATINRVVVPLDEPLAGRRIYTLLADELPDTGAFADDLADSVIGLDIDAATDAVRATGGSVRIIDSNEVDSDFDPTRMNLWVEDGIVTFAEPY